MNLKTSLLFLGFVVLTASTGLYAQLLVGPEAGANLSWSSFGDKDLNNTYRVKPIVGFNVGGHVGFRVRKRFFLHVSLLYSTKGRIIQRKTGNANLDDKLKLNYIDMPIIYTVDFKGKIGHNKEFKYNLGIGPTVSYWLGGKGVIEDDNTDEFSPNGNVKQPYKVVFGRKPGNANIDEMTIESYNRVQLGLTLTASVIFEPVVHRHIMATLRYEIGGTYLSGTSSGYFGATIFQEPLATKNKGLRFSLTYLLDTRIDQRKRGKSTHNKRRK